MRGRFPLPPSGNRISFQKKMSGGNVFKRVETSAGVFLGLPRAAKGPLPTLLELSRGAVRAAIAKEGRSSGGGGSVVQNLWRLPNELLAEDFLGRLSASQLLEAEAAAVRSGRGPLPHTSELWRRHCEAEFGAGRTKPQDQTWRMTFLALRRREAEAMARFKQRAVKEAAESKAKQAKTKVLQSRAISTAAERRRLPATTASAVAAAAPKRPKLGAASSPARGVLLKKVRADLRREGAKRTI